MNYKGLLLAMLPIMTAAFNTHDRQIPLPKVDKPNKALLQKLEQQRNKKKKKR